MGEKRRTISVTGEIVMETDPGFEVRLDTHWVLIVQLDGGRLLAVDVAAQTPARYRDDGDRTCTEPGEMVLLGECRSLDVSDRA